MSRALLFVLALSAIEPLPARLCDVTTETSLPHLEENLRYSITHEKRCLAEKDFSTAFPVFAHPGASELSARPRRTHCGSHLVCPELRERPRYNGTSPVGPG